MRSLHLTLSVLLLAPTAAVAQTQTPNHTTSLAVGDAKLQIEYRGATPDLPYADIDDHIRQAAENVRAFYGRFPVASAKVIVMVSDSGHGVHGGTTWGDRGGFPAMSRIGLGAHTTAADWHSDWTTTHELTHTALSDLPDDQHWLEEGIATYVEPIARAQAGQLTAAEVWQGMVDGLPKGEPADGDRGLNNTHSWGRTYWGGALFCLAADIEIRRQTHNTRGLQDALRAIVQAGDTLNTSRPIEQVLADGDKATGTHVLSTMYARWSSQPVPVDLPALWSQLGVKASNGSITFDDSAPLAAVRRSITASPR